MSKYRQWIVDGYGTLFAEIDEQLGKRTIHLVAVPTGVGSLLQAALQHYPATSGRPQPRARPSSRSSRSQPRAYAASLAAGKPVSVETSHPPSWLA